MGLSSSCWLCLHMSNVWPHQKFVWLVTLEFLQMKAVKSCMAAVIFELSMLVSLIKEHTVQPIPTNMFLSFSLALAQPFFDSCLPCLQLATTGNGGHSGSLNLCRIYWLSCIMGMYEAGGTRSATLLPCFPHYTAFPGCSPIAWLHPIIALHAPDCICTWSSHISSGGHNLAFILCTKVSNPKLETMCLSKLSIFIMSITKCNKR